MPKTKVLGLLDACLLAMETRETHMHLAGTSIFRLPAGAPPDYVRKLYHAWRRHPVGRPPFNYRLTSSIGSVRPTWEVVDHVDLGQHLFHLALPYPGGDRELSELVSQLDSLQLDRRRPMWTIYLIEGLGERRFAIHLKIHHALADGATATRLFTRLYSEDPAARGAAPPWEGASGENDEQADKRRVTVDRPSKVPQMLSGGYESVAGLYQKLGSLKSLVADLKALARTDVGAPDTILNGPITSKRVSDTVVLDLARLRKLSKAGGATVNDAALAICAGALRRYLQELGELPRESLRCLVPVALRREGNPSGGNTGSAMTVPLGTDIADAGDRLAAICAATRVGKGALQDTSSDAIKTVRGILLLLPLAIEYLSGTRPFGPSPFNLTISNVPGPTHRLYMNGAELETIVSGFLVGPGLALNMLLTSYHDKFFINYTACPDNLPNIAGLGQLVVKSFAELEVALGTAMAGRLKPARRTGRPERLEADAPSGGRKARSVRIARGKVRHRDSPGRT